MGTGFPSENAITQKASRFPINREALSGTRTIDGRGPKSTRRDVLRVATGIAGAVGVIAAVGTAAVIVPQLDRTDTDPNVPIEPDAVDVDLSPVKPGQQIMMVWRSWPVFVVRRTPQALATLQAPSLLSAAVRSRFQGHAAAALCGQLAAVR